MATESSRCIGTEVVVCVSVSSGCCNKYHRLGGLNNRHPSSHSCRDWEVQDKVPAGLILGEGSLRSLQILLSYCMFTWIFFFERERETEKYRETERDIAFVSLSLFIKVFVIS